MGYCVGMKTNLTGTEEKEIKTQVLVEKAYMVANRWAQQQISILFTPIIDKASAIVEITNPDQAHFEGSVTFKYGDSDSRFLVDFSRTPSHRLLFTSYATKYAAGCNFFEIQT